MNRWKVERRRFLGAVNSDDPGAAYYTLGRVRAFVEAGEIEAMADGWALRRIKWLDDRTKSGHGDHGGKP